MFEGLRKIFGIEADTSGLDRGGVSGSVREIADALDRLPPERARHLASFAYILGRVANVDLEVTPEETRLIVRIAKSQHELFGATESYVVTREFARSSSEEEKNALLECLFAVSASDNEVSGIEEAEIRKIAGELGLSHADFIAARFRVREQIPLLKPPDPRD